MFLWRLVGPSFRFNCWNGWSFRSRGTHLDSSSKLFYLLIFPSSNNLFKIYLSFNWKWKTEQWRVIHNYLTIQIWIMLCLNKNKSTYLFAAIIFRQFEHFLGLWIGALLLFFAGVFGTLWNLVLVDCKLRFIIFMRSKCSKSSEKIKWL